VLQNRPDMPSGGKSLTALRQHHASEEADLPGRAGLFCR
jgi:hypothetical protein